MGLFSKLKGFGNDQSDSKPETEKAVGKKAVSAKDFQASTKIYELPPPENLEDESLLLDRKSNMTRIVSPNSIQKIYGQINSGASEISWMLLKFSNTVARGKVIYLAASGLDYDDFLKLLCDDSHIAYGFANLQYTTKDKSREETNVLICWVGKHTKLTEKAAVCADREEVIEMLKDHDKMYVTGLKSEIVMQRITFNAQLSKF